MSAGRYRKKPVVVDAVQWTGGNLATLRIFTGERPNGERRFLLPDDITGVMEASAQIYDELHRTWVNVDVGDWIIRGIQGEFYPCRDDVFWTTYEPEPTL